MFFKNKVTIEDYCRGKLTRLFSQERETTWDDLKIRCNDAHLNQADRKAYYDNLRAAMIQLMMIPVAKTFHWKVRYEVGEFVTHFPVEGFRNRNHHQKERCLTELAS